MITKSPWVTSDFEETAALSLRRALGPLEVDYSKASGEASAQTRAPASLGAGNDGDAFWFLSPIEPVTEQFVQNDRGQPVWQRNILYYLSVPANHTGCSGVATREGYDQGCPHKVLVRKVINYPGVDGSQALLNNVTPYLTRPRSETDATSVGSGQDKAEVVGTKLLWFRVLPDPSGEKGVRLVVVRSVALDAARATGTATGSGYAESPQTHFVRWPLAARN